MAGFCLLGAGVSDAEGSTWFTQGFLGATVDAPGGSVLLPATSAGRNVACLSASGPMSNPLRDCKTAGGDLPGSGALRLTDTGTNEVGAVFGGTSVPTAAGLVITFDLHQWGGSGNGGDGMAFVLAAVDPTKRGSPVSAGQGGGALGYSAVSGHGLGLADGYLGFGFDAYGNFSNHVFEGTGCQDRSFIGSGSTRLPNQLLVRGPGNGTSGYCGLASTVGTYPGIPTQGRTRASSSEPVEIVINPGSTRASTPWGWQVPPASYRVSYGGDHRITFAGALPSAAGVGSPVIPSAWLTSTGVPQQLAFGWTASTGSQTDNHEVTNVSVRSLAPVPQLTAGQTSQVASTTGFLPVSSPVTYQVTSGVAAGVDEAGPVYLTETTPAGVTPVGGFGTGWSCGPASGQRLVCSNTSGPFRAASFLPMLTVNGRVTTANTVTAAIVQTRSTVAASSADGRPSYPGPTVTGISPTQSVAAGGSSGIITGTNLTSATAIKIGDPAERATGTEPTLAPCSTPVISGCFSITSPTTISIASMPAHSTGFVKITVVAFDVSSTPQSYLYVGLPAAAQDVKVHPTYLSGWIEWFTPSDAGTPIRGYYLYIYRVGVLVDTIPIPAFSALDIPVKLTAGLSYTVGVAAWNSQGTGPTVMSSAFVPYRLPDAPTAATAKAWLGPGTATVSWAAPANDGYSPIIGYEVIPYLNGLPKPTRHFPSPVTTEIITGLSANSSYTFTVLAENAAGFGAPSAPSGKITTNAVPTLKSRAPTTGR